MNILLTLKTLNIQFNDIFDCSFFLNDNYELFLDFKHVLHKTMMS